jgi:hypothetical protein
VGINKDNKRKLQIASTDQHQDKPKRRTAEHPQRNKKIGATTQNENEEYKGYGMESDEENEHESEQERSNSNDGNALESEQENQSGAVSACTNSTRMDVKKALKSL